MEIAYCFMSHFLSNEWDLVHISHGGGMVKFMGRFIFSHVRERAKTNITFAQEE